ncbi:transporter substrate-binding domain-containing protein [Fusibacter paucivorans]|uniref:Transporter substrate-binding domain-containing protein n=1 Tax=Fusibacter paucivorans TaxID=76009 RepID=A0ABS5PRR7_9FIRM|nr:transporter substrate-binding domain-containing protein [Fusibacter paucivorans]MBS7527860.1 transporter substrate-binding domain-containing protein [Fusibacter paucivorans]
MKKFVILLLTFVMLFSMTACGAKEEAAPEKTKLVLGTSADYPPFEFIVLDDNGDQEYAGIDVSFAKKIADDMGLELEIVNMSFDNLMASLQKGEIDMVIAAIEASEERAEVADFSDPYYTDLPPMVVTKAENVGDYTSLESFDGKTVGAQMGTTKADIVSNDMMGANLVTMSTVTDLVNNVVYDKCDAIVLDGAVAQQYAENDDNLAIAEVSLGEAYPYCVAVQKNDPLGLLESINTTVAAVTTDGSMDTWIQEANDLSDQAIE